MGEFFSGFWESKRLFSVRLFSCHDSNIGKWWSLWSNVVATVGIDNRLTVCLSFNEVQFSLMAETVSMSSPYRNLVRWPVLARESVCIEPASGLRLAEWRVCVVQHVHLVNCFKSERGHMKLLYHMYSFSAPQKVASWDERCSTSNWAIAFSRRTPTVRNYFPSMLICTVNFMLVFICLDLADFWLDCPCNNCWSLITLLLSCRMSYQGQKNRSASDWIIWLVTCWCNSCSTLHLIKATPISTYRSCKNVSLN